MFLISPIFWFALSWMFLPVKSLARKNSCACALDHALFVCPAAPFCSFAPYRSLVDCAADAVPTPSAATAPTVTNVNNFCFNDNTFINFLACGNETPI
jgi:hypothetical protein